MKKKLAVAVTVALLAFPLSTAIAQACLPDAPISVASNVFHVTTLDEAVQTAEDAVVDYELAPITTLELVATAEGLKATAVAAIADLEVDSTEKADLKVRVTTQKAAIKAAEIELTPPVVEDDGKIVIPSTQFSDFIDNLQLALTFDPARQGEINKRHALRKLAQANKLMQDGNIKASKICFGEYKDKIAKAQEFLNEAETPGSATAIALAKALENVEAKNIAVLSDLVVKFPPQAAQKLALNVVHTMDKAVFKVQKEEAKVAPVVVPVVKDDVEKKLVEKQAKPALLKFKNSVNEKNNLLQIKDREITDNQCTTDQKKLDVNQKLEKLSRINYRTSDENKAGWNKDNNRDKNDDRNNDKGGDNNSRDHR